jgi:hypothetical protein
MVQGIKLRAPLPLLTIAVTAFSSGGNGIQVIGAPSLLWTIPALGNDSKSWLLADNAMRRMTGYSLVSCRLAVEAHHLASTIVPQELESFDVK